jgi:hypothetical protein
MRYTITFEPEDFGPGANWSQAAAVRVRPKGSAASRLVGLRRTRQVGTLDSETAMAWLLERVRALVEVGDLDFSSEISSVEWVDIRTSEVTELTLFGQRGKTCSWKYPTGRELYCTAAAEPRPDSGRMALARITRDGPTPPKDADYVVVDGRYGAPTHEANCVSCDVPDEGLLCANFSHPRKSVDFNSRLVNSGVVAICRKGENLAVLPYDAESSDLLPSMCRPGQNDCWERVISTGSITPTSTPATTAVLEAFDHLNAVWRANYGGIRVLRLKSAEETGGLALGAETKLDFANQVVRIGELISNLIVDGSLLPAPAEGKRLPAGGIARLRLWASTCVEEIDRPIAEAAIERLAAVMKVRQCFGHSDPADLARAFGLCGIEFPPTSWEKSWAALQNLTISALRELRGVVERMESSD